MRHSRSLRPTSLPMYDMVSKMAVPSVSKPTCMAVHLFGAADIQIGRTRRVWGHTMQADHMFRQGSPIHHLHEWCLCC